MVPSIPSAGLTRMIIFQGPTRAIVFLCSTRVTRATGVISRVAALSALGFFVCSMAAAQQTQQTYSAPAGGAISTAEECHPLNWTAEQDHQDMMNELGIRALRPGPSGNENAPNHANYDESKANPFRDLPDALALKNGQRVTTADQWWHVRRPEIVEDFEREVLGRIPRNVPKVTWSVASTANSKTGSFPVIEKQVVGHVDNSSCPAITVDIQMTLATPANAKGPVPVMIMFSSPAFRKRMEEMLAARPELKASLGTDPPEDGVMRCSTPVAFNRTTAQG
jgi:hypothetical protein